MRTVFLCITIQSTGNCQKSSNTGSTIGTNINDKQEINPASNEYRGKKWSRRSVSKTGQCLLTFNLEPRRYPYLFLEYYLRTILRVKFWAIFVSSRKLFILQDRQEHRSLTLTASLKQPGQVASALIILHPDKAIFCPFLEIERHIKMSRLLTLSP